MLNTYRRSYLTFSFSRKAATKSVSP